MTTLTKKHILTVLAKNVREDKRGLLDYRAPILIEKGVSAKSAEGSARVVIGETEVVAGVKLEVGAPFPDTQDEGVLMVNMELLPLSNPHFESGPPSAESIELSRVIDRCIRESNTIDNKKLCIKEGEKVWMVMIDIYPINDDGNLFDAASLAALAALQDARFPVYDAKKGIIDYSKPRTTKALPLQHQPLEVTVIKIGDHYLVDPTSEEEECLDARLTVATLEDNTICAMQKGGDDTLTADDIVKMVSISTDKIKMLRKLLK